MRSRAPAIALLAAALLGTAAWGGIGPAAAALPEADAELRRWVAELKTAPRGPFQAIRWFCADGTVHPPKPYPCAERGGGIQHGLWKDRVRALREEGFAVANVLADLRGEDFSSADADLETLRQILVERFLMQADDGWIFRGALDYRGALQIEDEEAGAARVLRAAAADPRWREPVRFALLREAVRLLPRAADSTTATRVRQLAVVIAEKDAGFAGLRAKIHNAPDAGDAESVRAYARTRGEPELADAYEELAAGIDSLYAEQGAAEALEAVADASGDPDVARKLRISAHELRGADTPSRRLAVASRLLRELRGRVGGADSAEGALMLLRASLVVEGAAFAAGNGILADLAGATRLQRLRWLGDAAVALYGAGLLSNRQLGELGRTFARVEGDRGLTVGEYRRALGYLARVPEWASRWVAFHFSRAVEKLARLDPLAHLYPQDRLRGSPLLFYSAVIDSLVRDANQLAGLEHQLFGEPVGAGLRALNPGLARGTLRSTDGESFARDGIYLLPETVSELPRIEGILTMGEGSSLSHVQLLARNLGIPNVVVGDELLPSVRERLASAVVLAVSPQGVVQLAADGPRWDAIFGAPAGADGGALVIRPDLEKLDLSQTDLVPLARLRATNSGRVSGPKGANLGELMHHFPDAVPPGLVIPFGAFRELIEQPIEPGGPSVFEWMKARYAVIGTLSQDSERRQQLVASFLAELRGWIEQSDPGPEFREKLRLALERHFGPDGSYGVFIRSDTNVEDLPGFTGAGLNLTVPNVVGFDAIYDGIRRVWASPFTERAFGWRQENMESPEYVFPAVLLQLGFPAEKSGVLVTADVETGSRDQLSVAVSEGVGGAVEGQAAEALRIDARTGKVRLLAHGTAPLRTVLPATGGVAKAPASGTDAILRPGEIRQLVELAHRVESFPSLRGADGEPLPADIEFAFRDGRLALLQIRPFVESRNAQRNLYLAELDAGFEQRGTARVELAGIPLASTR